MIALLTIFWTSSLVGIEKLELNLTVEPIQEGILFPFIHINIIRCIQHLSELIEVLIHSHSILLQFRELLLFQFERTTRYIVSSKSSFELILGDSTSILVRVVVCFSPISSGPK
jgi:hypothetical protein